MTGKVEERRSGEATGRDRADVRRLVFVGGAPRSGTTLVQNILDSHPEIAGGPEFLHLPEILALRKGLRYSVGRGWIDLFCGKDRVDEVIRDLVGDLLLPFAEERGATVLSEKTPDNVMVFDELLELFPEARLIHVVRDPRAVVASMLKVGRRAEEHGWKTDDFTRHLSDAIEKLRASLEAGFAAAERAPERVLDVRYERLVMDPEAESRRLCRFLDLSWSERMLHPGEVAHPGEDAITNRVWYRTEEYRRDPDPSEIEKWRRQLSAWQERTIRLAFADDSRLRALGYSLAEGESGGLGLRFAAVRAVARAVPSGVLVRLADAASRCASAAGRAQEILKIHGRRGP